MNKEYFMNLALKEAKKAFDNNEVPVGCVIVLDGKVISKAYNTRNSKKDITCHAEINAIRKASKKLNSIQLLNCEIYVTLEPCLMCCGAIYDSRISKVYFGAINPDYGCVSSLINYFTIQKNHLVNVEGHILEEESKELLSNFFTQRR